jgi:hypothetical protein
LKNFCRKKGQSKPVRLAPFKFVMLNYSLKLGKSNEKPFKIAKAGFIFSLLAAGLLGACNRQALQPDGVETLAEAAKTQAKTQSGMNYSLAQTDPIQYRLDLLARGLMGFVVNNDEVFRGVLIHEASKQFDQDYNVLFDRLASVMRMSYNGNYNLAQRMRDYLLTAYPAEAGMIQAVFYGCEQPTFSFAMQISDGTLHPQVYVSSFAYLSGLEGGVCSCPILPPTATPTVGSSWFNAMMQTPRPPIFNGSPVIVAAPSDDAADLVPGYKLTNGAVTTTQVNEAYAEQNPVWVVSINEGEISSAELSTLLSTRIHRQFCGYCNTYTPAPPPVRTESDPMIKVEIPQFRINVFKESWLAGACEVRIKRRKCRLNEISSAHTLMLDAVRSFENVKNDDGSDLLGNVSRRDVRNQNWQYPYKFLYANNRNEVEVWRNSPTDQIYSYFVVFEHDKRLALKGPMPLPPTNPTLPDLINYIQQNLDNLETRKEFKEEIVPIAPNFLAPLRFSSEQGPFAKGVILARKPPVANSAWTYQRTFGDGSQVEFNTVVTFEQDQ